jgi:DNA-binding NarL/FixJ family response regulator
MATRPRILAAGGRTLVVGTLAKLLESRFEIVGTAADSKELVEVASRLNPDLVIVDRRLQDAADALRELLPNTKQIVLTMDEDYELEAVSLEGWGSGFPLKSPAGRKLILTIGKVLKGTNIIPETPQKAFDRFLRDLRANREKRLTPRQRDVLRLLAEGRTMKEAAEVLHVTTRTIAFHKYTMMEAFGLKTNSDLFRFAIKNRVITVF